MTTTPNAGAGVSRYLRLYSVLSQALAEKRIGAGEPLPSEPRLMREYAVSRSTVRRALARLESEGRIVRRRGSGTYAREDQQATPASAVLDDAAGLPAATISRLLIFERIPTPAFLPTGQPGFGGSTLLTRRIRYLGSEPVVFESAYVPEEIGGRLTRHRLGSENGAMLALLASLGHRSSSLEREFAALPADPAAAKALGLAIGAPVLNVRALARDSHRRILAYLNLCCRPLSAGLSKRGLDRGVARYYRLYELLLVALQDGTIPANAALPSEPRLCVQHGLSRTTVRRALDRLEREGRIVRRRGSGTYARAQRSPPRLRLELHALPDALRALESGTTTRTVRFSPAPVPAPLRAMAADMGSTAYLLERLRCHRGEPVSLTTAYLPEPLGPHHRPPVPSRAAAMRLLDRLRSSSAAATLSLGAVPADADAARVLQVPLGSPLLRMRGTLTDGAGRVRAVLESLCRSDRLQLRITELKH